MSQFKPFSSTIPESIRQAGEVLLPQNHPCRFLGEHIQEFLTEDDFATLYSTAGRPGVSPIVLAIVTILQFMEKLPDRRAAEQVVMRIDWKYALHLELLYLGFHYSDLCNFRKRLEENNAIMGVFDKLIAYLVDMKWIEKRGKQRTDSTHILANVKRLSVFELRRESLRLALKELFQTNPEWVKTHLSEAFAEAYAFSLNTYHMSETKLKEAEKQVEQDLKHFIETVETQGKPEFKELIRVRMAQKVAKQSPKCIDPSEFPDWKDEVAFPEGEIRSPHNPEARYSKKRDLVWVGEKAQITETVTEDGKNFITDVLVTPANVSDIGVLETIQDRVQAHGIEISEQYVDKGYMSADKILTSAEKGIDLRGEVQDSASCKDDGVQLKDFQVDIAGRKAICPMGKESVRWSEPTGTKGVKYRASFGKQCQLCPLFGKCTERPSGRNIDISANHDTLQQRRREQKTEEFKQEMKQRAGIESTISEAVRGHGLRKSRYRGTAKMQLQAAFTGVAINVKRLAKWMEGGEFLPYF